MATQNSTETTTEHAMKPFQWCDKETARVPGVHLAGRTLELALGIQCVAELLQTNALEKDYGTPPLNENQEGRLMGLVIAAARGLADDASHYLEWAQKHGHDACASVASRPPATPN